MRLKFLLFILLLSAGILNAQSQISKVYEAESGSNGGGPTVKAATNASGGKVVTDFSAVGAQNKIPSVDGGTAGGTGTIKVRYSNGNATEGGLTFFSYKPDGSTVVLVGKVKFPTTGDWNTFAEVTIPYTWTLVAGNVVGNAFKFRKEADDAASVDIDNYTVIVTATLVNSVTVTPTTLSLEKGTTGTLTATVDPADATKPALTWTSSQPTIAKVSASGVVTAMERGTATITAASTDGSNKSATSEITVYSPPLADTIRSLIITESRMTGNGQNYIEITNMGDKPVQLSQFELGKLTPWSPLPRYTNETNNFFRLPEKLLQPGKSFVIALRFEFAPKQFAKGLDGFGELETKPDVIAVADLILDAQESKGGPGTEDLITPNWQTLNEFTGRGVWFLEQHLSNVDSLVVDQVGGVFDGTNGMNVNAEPISYSVAGMANATGDAVLIRKFSVKNGNLDFANARGVGADDSEWIPVPLARLRGNNEGSVWRSAWWTLGNHGNNNLDENTLKSDIIDIDFANKTMKVPFGTRTQDDIMNFIKKAPGVAWEYIYVRSSADSIYQSVRTGDQLKVWVCGNDADIAVFNLIAAPPVSSANMVIPLNNMDPQGDWRSNLQEGNIYWPRVTRHESGIDTIWGARGGIPYATRVDSLLERLEKAPNANWEIVSVDGVARPDLKNGDNLKVTAENGAVKQYYISVLPLRPVHNAYLSSITFPDLPKEYQGLYGWVGDTIPGFGSLVNNYRVSVPLDVQGIPALVAKTEDPNAKVTVKRAANINGTVAERTITFTVTAADDTTVVVYNVELIKEKDPDNIQPYSADPFISEFIFWDQWANGFMEIANPGNQPLDLSDYLIYGQWQNNPASAIQAFSGPNDWNNRYAKYVPGYKWVNEIKWAVTPGILEQDLNVNTIVQPGDVFSMGSISTDAFSKAGPNYVWPVPAQLDIQFKMYTSGTTGTKYSNPWNEKVGENCAGQWVGANIFVFKILNDSVKLGLKPANDPNDFKLIETMGTPDNSNWIIGGKAAAMITNWMRKPEIYKGNTAFKGSFGTNPDDAEWTWTNQAYWDKQNAGWPLNILNIGNNLGQHFMNPPTHYMSTVSSAVYKVSPGYSDKESIKGMKTGTTVSNFLASITKANEKQTLKVKRASSDELEMDAVLLMNDTLTVMSADSINTTKYVLNVTTDGLSPNAVITSTRYTVTIEKQPKSAGNENAGVGKVTGFDYGTVLRTVLANIVVPTGASMTVINGDGAYVPLKMLNYDTAYVNVTVNSDIYLSVIAENGVTEIVYQLIPSASENDAFVTSDVYSVVQKDVLIQFVPRGTDVRSFMANLVPSAGATMKLMDKMGNERLNGAVADDDKVVVTSKNGSFSKVYFISKQATQYVPVTTYLAYILSNVYAIDQVMYKVAEVSGTETVSSFLTKVTPSAGAAVAVVDKDGTVKINGDIDGGDKVMVTSADGKIKVYYSFGPLTSARDFESNNIELYPNPTNDEINVSGVNTGQRIQVYNSAGAAIREINVQNSIERISLGNQPAGMYMIVVSDNNKLIGRYKLMKR